jgi:hypothetical protein
MILEVSMPYSVKSGRGAVRAKLQTADSRVFHITAVPVIPRFCAANRGQT